MSTFFNVEARTTKDVHFMQYLCRNRSTEGGGEGYLHMNMNQNPCRYDPKAGGYITMKYTPEEREEIGRLIYEGRMSRADAAIKYKISIYTARDYLRLYKAKVRAENEKTAKEDTVSG